MSYDGTVTLSDPALVETFELDDQTTAYILRDWEAEAPDGDGIGYIYRISDSHSRYDDTVVSGDYGDTGADTAPIREAWDRFRDWGTVGRYLRMFHGAVSFDYSSGLDRDGTVVAVVTTDQATAWGVAPADWSELASQALETVRPWFEGDAYGVIVVNTVTGDEESVWEVFDSSPDLSYVRQTADDIAPIGVV